MSSTQPPLGGGGVDGSSSSSSSNVPVTEQQTTWLCPYDTTCTACGERIEEHEDAARHAELGVLIDAECSARTLTKHTVDADGDNEECTWCGYVTNILFVLFLDTALYSAICLSSSTFWRGVARSQSTLLQDVCASAYIYIYFLSSTMKGMEMGRT